MSSKQKSSNPLGGNPIDDDECGFVLVEEPNWREGKTFGALLEHSCKNSLCHDMEFLFESGKTIPFSKFILRLRSSYFDELLCDAGRNQITVRDDNPENFGIMLKYLYTDKLDVTDKNILDLRNIASRYIITGMEQALSCKTLFDCELNGNNAVTLYQIAQVLKEYTYSDRALAFIVRNMAKVTLSNDFLNITYDNLCAILERDDLEIEEVNLLRGVVQWGQKESEQTKRNINKILERPLKLIRYSAVGMTDYSMRSMLQRLNVILPLVTNTLRNNPLGLDLSTSVINRTNVVKYLKLAVGSNDQVSVTKAFKYMENNAKNILAKDEFLELNLEHLHTLLESDNLIVDSELDVLHGVIRWGEAECQRRCIEAQPRNIRQLLGKTLLQIRFGYLSVKDFECRVVKNLKGLLVAEEIANVLLYSTHTPQKEEPQPVCMFATNRRKGFTVYRVSFLPDKVHLGAFESYSIPKSFHDMYSYWFPSIKAEFDGNLFWRAFSVDKPIQVISFGFYGPLGDNDVVDVRFSLREMPPGKLFQEAGKLIATQSLTLNGLVKEDTFHVKFDEPVPLQPNYTYLAGFSLQRSIMCGHRILAENDGRFVSQQEIFVFLKSGIAVRFNVINDEHSSIKAGIFNKRKCVYGQFPEIHFVA